MLSLITQKALAAGVCVAAGVIYVLVRRRRPSQPKRVKLITSSVAPTVPPVVLKRLWIDAGMGGFDYFYLATTWFYDAPVDVEAIEVALQAVVNQMPALAGRRTSAGIVLCNKGARLSVVDGFEGSASDWSGAVSSSATHTEPTRGIFTDMPSSTRKQPLFTVRVTHFQDGSSAVGIASPHMLMDGKSYVDVARALAAAYANHVAPKDAEMVALPAPDFDAARVWEAAAKAVGSDKQPTAWIPAGLVNSMMALAFGWVLQPRIDAFMPRAKVHLSRAELSELKQAAIAVAGSGAASATTNEVLEAAVLLAIAGVPAGGAFKPGQRPVVGMFVRALGKGAFAGAGDIAGNFTWLLDRRTPKPATEMSMADALELFHAIGDEWRDEAAAARAVEGCVHFHSVPDLTGWWWDETTFYGEAGSMSDLQINNQSSYPIEKVRFGPGALVGLHPWHSHAHVHILAAPEPRALDGAAKEATVARPRLAGGVDLYVPKSLSPELGTPRFKERLLRGWRR
eukprot:5911367-Prymnesium_polylepis.1